MVVFVLKCLFNQSSNTSHK